MKICRARVNPEARWLTQHRDCGSLPSNGGAKGSGAAILNTKIGRRDPPDRRARQIGPHYLTLGLSVNDFRGRRKISRLQEQLEIAATEDPKIQRYEAPQGRMPRAGGEFLPTVSLIAYTNLFLHTPLQSYPPHVGSHRQPRQSRRSSPRRRRERTGL
jgi:hypothetical protein